MAQIAWLTHNNDRSARTAHAYRLGLPGPMVSACGRPLPALTLDAHPTSARCGTCVKLATDMSTHHEPATDTTEPTPEQAARDILDRMGVDGAQQMTTGDLVELANLVAEVRRLRDALEMGGAEWSRMASEYDALRGRAESADAMRRLLVKYIDHVGRCEGDDFLSDHHRDVSARYMEDPITDEEWRHLRALGEVAR